MGSAVGAAPEAIVSSPTGDREEAGAVRGRARSSGGRTARSSCYRAPGAGASTTGWGPIGCATISRGDWSYGCGSTSGTYASPADTCSAAETCSATNAAGPGRTAECAAATGSDRGHHWAYASHPGRSSPGPGRSSTRTTNSDAGGTNPSRCTRTFSGSSASPSTQRGCDGDQPSRHCSSFTVRHRRGASHG